MEVEPQPESPGRLPQLKAARPRGLGERTWRELASELLHRLGTETQSIFTWDDLPVLLDSLAFELEAATNAMQNSFSHQRLVDLFGMFHAHPLGGQERLRGATVLEVGAGAVNPLGLSLVQVMFGARRAIATEPDPLRNTRTAVMALARTLAWGVSAPELLAPRFSTTREAVAERIAGFDVGLLRRGDPAGIDSSRLQFLPSRIDSLALPDNSVDIVFSNSVLEHVEDVEAGIRELARVSRSGALATHHIDGLDHRHWSAPGMHPLEFLTEDSREVIVHMCNRIRPKDFAPLFEEHGFEIVGSHVDHRCEVDDYILPRMVEPYRSMDRESLEAGMMLYYLRRR